MLAGTGPWQGMLAVGRVPAQRVEMYSVPMEKICKQGDLANRKCHSVATAGLRQAPP